MTTNIDKSSNQSLIYNQPIQKYNFHKINIYASYDESLIVHIYTV